MSEKREEDFSIDKKYTINFVFQKSILEDESNLMKNKILRQEK